MPKKAKKQESEINVSIFEDEEDYEQVLHAAGIKKIGDLNLTIQYEDDTFEDSTANIFIVEIGYSNGIRFDEYGDMLPDPSNTKTHILWPEELLDEEEDFDQEFFKQKKNFKPKKKYKNKGEAISDLKQYYKNEHKKWKENK